MGRKKTIEEVDEAFKNVGLILLEKEYKNATTKMKFICPKHKDKGEQYITYARVSQGQGCKYCGIQRRVEKARHDKEKVIKDFEDAGFMLLDTNYQTVHQRLKCVCNKHPDIIQYKTYKSIIEGQGCAYCSGVVKHTYEEVKQVFKEKGLKLLATEYVNAITPMPYECEKHPGYIHYLSYNKLTNGRGCPRCSNHVFRDYDEVYQMFADKGYELLETEYKNSFTKMKYKCPNHPDKELYIELNSLMQGHGCPYCAGTIKHTFEEVKKLFEEKGFVLLSTEYINSKQKLQYKCNKHPDKIQEIDLIHLLRGQGCQYCAETDGERIIRLWLEENNINYESQKKFEDLYRFRPQNKLSYDFFLPKYNLLIEYQGPRHYGKFFYNNPTIEELKKYLDQLQRDRLKYQYAISNDYKLLEIWDRDINKISKILRKELNIIEPTLPGFRSYNDSK